MSTYHIRNGRKSLGGSSVIPDADMEKKMFFPFSDAKNLAIGEHIDADNSVISCLFHYF